MDQMAERAWIFYIKFFRKRRSLAKQGFPLFFCIAPAAGNKGRAIGQTVWRRFASFDMMSGYVYTKTGDVEAMISCKKADEQSSSWGDRLFDGVYLAEFAFSREIIDECPLSCLNL